DGPIELPKLDGFSGDRCYSFGPGKPAGGVYGSADFAWEEHIDNYLMRFAKPLARILRFAEPRDAIYLILNARRPGRKNEERDRMKAAYKMASFAKDQVRLQRICKKLGVYIDYDSYGTKGDVMGAWLWLDSDFTGIFVETCDGRLFLGNGDGYHRQGSFECLHELPGMCEDPPDDETVAQEEEDQQWMLDPVFYRSYDLGDARACQGAILRACNLGVDSGREWQCPCDEKYWHEYERLKPLLEARVAKRSPAKKAAMTKLRKILNDS
ncbi:MAG: hypothetical protein ACREGR_02190, partial [Minisyncoccia bacterium]